MSVRHLEFLFRPGSIAVVGASNRAHSVGHVVVRNLLRGGFSGPVMPVNPKYEAVAGVLTYPDIASLPITPDLAVICTPPSIVPDLVKELGDSGTRAVVVLTAGLSAVTDIDGRTLQQKMLDAARRHFLRIMGPNCLGLMVPGLGLNATFAHAEALPGRLAFVSQSGALCTAVLDWARTPGPHGGNPYTKGFVRLAEEMLIVEVPGTFKVWIEVEELDGLGDPVADRRGGLTLDLLEGGDVGTFDTADDASVFANRLQELAKRTPHDRKVATFALSTGGYETILVCEHGKPLTRWQEDGYYTVRYVDELVPLVEGDPVVRLRYSGEEGEGNGEHQSWDCNECGPVFMPSGVQIDYMS